MDDKPNIPTEKALNQEKSVEVADVKVSSSTITINELLRQKWREYVIEILVIILGITISFALNAWKDRQSKNELEQLYLKSLYNDISSDIETLQVTIDASQKVVVKAKSLLAYNKQGNLTHLNQGQFLLDLKGVFDRPNFVANDATFTDLKSSGNMQTITDFELKNSLFNYYKQYEAIKALETAERDATLLLVAPYILKHFSLNDQSLDFTKSKIAITTALKDIEYVNSIFVRLANREELVNEYKNILSRGQKIKVALQKQIKSY